MSTTPWTFVHDSTKRLTPSDLTKTHAERLALEQHAREHQRRLDLAEQRSDQNSPAERIRVWERLHGLRLPGDPSHPVLDIIAIGTRLTLSEVQEEQRLRSARPAAAGRESPTATAKLG
jgi:hypothetical protein